MTLRQLSYFYHLADDPHVHKAAKKLNVSQPAISLAIRNLEEELGEALFSRIGKKLILNERGRYFRDKSIGHYRALRDAGNMFKSDRIVGSLEIAASKTFNTHVMPQILHDFRLQYPSVEIHKQSANTMNIIRGLLDGEWDLGFVERDFNEDKLIKEKIGDDELVIVSSDPSLSKGSHFIDNLLDRRWVLREEGSGTRDVFLDSLAVLGLKPRIFLELSEFDEIKALLLANPGTISCISKLRVAAEIDRGELFNISLKNLTFTRELFTVYHRSRYRSMLFDRFYEFAREGFQAEVSRTQ